jgi:hypothetical protein
MFRNGRPPGTASAVRSEARIWRALRNGATWLAVLVALYALLGFLVLPTLVKPRLETALSERFSRQATLARLEFNPFTWHARLLDFALTDRDPPRPFVRFDALDLDVSPASIRYRAPVLDTVRLARLQVDVTRNEDGTYSVDDLVTASPNEPKDAEAGPPLFSLNNIEVDDAIVTLDDRPHANKIVVSSLDIGIPFVSSIPHDAEIRVKPKLQGAVDGTPFGLKGDASSPFADTREATLDLDLEALPLPRYAEYVALPAKTKLASGALTTHLKLAFVTEKGVARTIALSGRARVEEPALARSDGTRLVSARSIDVGLAKLDVLARSIALDTLTIDAPEADVRREADGTLELARTFASTPPKPEAAKTEAAKAPERPWRFSVADARVAGGTVHVADNAVSPAFRADLSNVGIEGKSIASAGGAGAIAVRFDAADGAHGELQADVDLAARNARGHVALGRLHLAKLYPYYAPALNVEVRGGTFDVDADFDAASAPTPRFILTSGTAALADFDVALPGAKETLWSVKRGDLAGVAFDLGKRTVAIDRVGLSQGSLNFVRDRDGTVNFERLVRKSAAAESLPRGEKAQDVGWRLRIARLDIAQIAANVQDRVPTPPVKLRVADARATIDDFSNADDARPAIDATARIGAKGRLRLKGTVAAKPAAADLRVDAAGIDLLPLRPYFEPRTNVVVTSGAASANGRLVFATTRSGAPNVSFKGDVAIADFDSLDRPGSQQLVRWKTLKLTGVDSRSEPLAINVGSIALDQFFARVILNADATLNLRQLLVAEPAPSRPPPATVAGVTTTELPPRAEGGALPVSIGRIEVSNGEVEYSDFFVQPNYNAHLTQMAGSVSALSATQAGAVEAAARVEGTAPVDIRGTINPFAAQVSLDLTAKASDVDLPPLTPYSIKYAGYGITKGKLSLEVHYKVEERRLAATNKLRLDQLTFGERVDSPTATKLPVLLAVSLLKDRNGVINLDLPISGTLDDPKFSVWRVVVQIFVNLITKAVTAPFALLASIGGGGEELAYVEFAPGRASLAPAALTKLGTLAKALNDRPGLKIDATGRAIPDADRDGLKRAMLDNAIRAQKQKALTEEGESAPPLAELTIASEEYPKLLTAVYKATDLLDKPRNVFGLAKSIPPAEMEALLLANYRVDDEALATLANRRAQAVKEWLAREGGVASERIFIVKPKLGGEGIKDPGAPTRVDFAIR